MNMDSITREKLLEYIPEYKAFIPEGKRTFTALDVLEIEGIQAGDRLSIVIGGGFISPSHLHEFACRCAERALGRIKDPDPRSAAAIQAKRKWMRGEISDEEMLDAYTAAENAALDATDPYKDSACAAASAAQLDGEEAADWGAEWSACSAEYEVERAWQVEELKKLLREDEA